MMLKTGIKCYKLLKKRMNFIKKRGIYMNKKNIIRINLCIIIMIFAMIPNFHLEAATLKMNTKKLTISVGGKYKLSMNTKRRVKWYSANKKIASVSSNGKVTGKKVGKTKITAKVNNRVFTCVVTVDNPKISQASYVLEKGIMHELEVTGTNRKVTWESTNEEIVLVEDGEIIGIKEGKAEVIASIGKDVELCCLVQVTNAKKIQAQTLYFNESNFILDTLGQTKKLQVNVVPYDAKEDCKLYWTSSDTNVATVNENGIVKANGDGLATIEVRSENGKSASCQIQVMIKEEVMTVRLDQTEIVFDSLTSQVQLNAEVRPGDALNQELEWKSNDETIVIVDNCGMVQPVQDGIAIITVSTKNGKSANCLVTVRLEDEIQIDETNIILVEKGEEKQISYHLKDISQEDNISWTSENKNVAVVNSQGIVKAVGNGSTIVQAKLKNGNFVHCKVVVHFKEDEKREEDSLNIIPPILNKPTLTLPNIDNNVMWNDSYITIYSD